MTSAFGILQTVGGTLKITLPHLFKQFSTSGDSPWLFLS